MSEEEIRNYLNRVNQIKSNILSYASLLEKLIESQMSERFTFNDDDEKKFHSLFFSNKDFTFSMKIDLLEKYLEKFEPDFSNIRTDFVNALHRIRRIRNDFAHGINPTPEQLNQFATRNSITIFTYDDYTLGEKEYPFELIEARFNDFDYIRNMMLVSWAKIMNQKSKTAREIAEKIRSETGISYQPQTQQDSEQQS